MHKSKEGHEGGAMVRVDRKCEAYVGVRGERCLLRPLRFCQKTLIIILIVSP